MEVRRERKRGGQAAGSERAAAGAASDYDKRHWYVNSEGQTYVVVDAQRPFRMGSPASEHGPDVKNEQQHWRRIGPRFAIAATPVTVEQFRHIRPAGPKFATKARNDGPENRNSPQTDLTWFRSGRILQLTQRGGWNTREPMVL